MMKHRKNVHGNTKSCKAYLLGKCLQNNDTGWWSHGEDFWEVPYKQIPPETIIGKQSTKPNKASSDVKPNENVRTKYKNDGTKYNYDKEHSGMKNVANKKQKMSVVFNYSNVKIIVAMKLR